jgi:hypothetical protein
MGEFPTIQAALDAAVNGDEVVLTSGVFRGVGNRELDLHGKAVVLRSEGNDTSMVVIDCEARGSAFLIHSGETRSTRVEGITVTMGSESESGLGGGAIECVGGAPLFRNCAFHHCDSGHGGVVYALSASPRFEACRFYDNGIVIPGQGGVFWAENGAAPQS